METREKIKRNLKIKRARYPWSSWRIILGEIKDVEKQIKIIRNGFIKITKVKAKMGSNQWKTIKVNRKIT